MHVVRATTFGRRPATRAVALLLLLVGGRTAHAQGVSRSADDASGPSATGPVPITARWERSHCLAGVTYGAPQKLALSWAGGLVREGVTANSSDYCAFGAAKLGVGGARASLGLGRSAGHLGGGVTLSADLLRTFANPLGASARRTYAGVTLHVLPLLALGGEIGYFVRLGDGAGASRDQRRIVTWSTGFGF